jgi:transcriptional regulator with XRE-family HTH domain
MPMAAQNGLGSHFRKIRNERGLALAAVADATGISSSFLSLFETGKSDITFGRLVPLLAYYGISITDVLPDPDPEQSVVVRRERRRHIESGSEHAAIELLVHNTRTKMAPVLVVLDAGGELSGVITAVGGELFVFVLSGEIELDRGEGSSIRLRKGDAAYIGTDHPRTYRNRGQKRAELLVVQAPPVI